MSNELAGSSGFSPGGAEGSRVATRTKFYFGAGAGGEAASMWIFNALGMIFYQQILGLPAGLAGTALAIAIFADAITDPLIGAISDRFRSKWGRRHPFLLIAPIPLAMCIFLIFHPPAFVLESHIHCCSYGSVFSLSCSGPSKRFTLFLISPWAQS